MRIIARQIKMTCEKFDSLMVDGNGEDLWVGRHGKVWGGTRRSYCQVESTGDPATMPRSVQCKES